MPNHKATISDPERAARWKTILGTATIPVTSYYPVYTHIKNHKKAKFVYLLDIDKLSQEQRARLVQQLAIEFEFTKRWVETLLEEHPVPIPADHVTILVERQPHMW